MGAHRNWLDDKQGRSSLFIPITEILYYYTILDITEFLFDLQNLTIKTVNKIENVSLTREQFNSSLKVTGKWLTAFTKSMVTQINM